MKTLIRLILPGLCAVSLMGLQAVRADNDTTNSNPPPQRHEFHLLPVFDQLNLTDAQKEQIKQIIRQTDEERRRKIDQVLTPEQKAKLDEIIAAHRTQQQQGGSGDNTPPPPPPQ